MSLCWTSELALVLVPRRVPRSSDRDPSSRIGVWLLASSQQWRNVRPTASARIPLQALFQCDRADRPLCRMVPPGAMQRGSSKRTFQIRASSDTRQRSLPAPCIDADLHRRLVRLEIGQNRRFMGVAGHLDLLLEPQVERIDTHGKDWRAVVIRLLNDARLVVVQPGGTDGVQWEFEQAMKVASPDRVLLFIPNSSSMEYQRFRLSSMAKQLRLPRDLESSRFIVFDSQWPASLPPASSNPSWMHFRRRLPLKEAELRPVFEATGVNPTVHRILRKTLVTLAALVLGCATLMAYSMLG